MGLFLIPNYLCKMFHLLVKDKDNVATFNQWSCGGYLNHLTDMIIYLNRTDFQWETNDNTLIITKLTDANVYGRVNINSLKINDIKGKTVTTSADIKVTSNTYASIQYWTTNSLGSVSINQADDFEKVTLSTTIPDDITNFEVRFFLNNLSKTNDLLKIKNIHISFNSIP